MQGRRVYIHPRMRGQKLRLYETLDGLEAEDADGKFYLLRNYRAEFCQPRWKVKDPGRLHYFKRLYYPTASRDPRCDRTIWRDIQVSRAKQSVNCCRTSTVTPHKMKNWRKIRSTVRALHKTSLCHPEPFGYAQDKLREGSHFSLCL